MAVASKLLVTKINMASTISSIVVQTLLSSDEAGIRVGFMFVETLVNEVYLNSHTMGYFNYTITLSEFTRQIVDRLFEAVFTVCCFVIEKFSQSYSHDLAVLVEHGLKAMLSLLSYPFENSYISFSSDQDLSDPCITIIPFDWANRLKEPMFFEYLQAISCSNAYPASSSLRLAAITLASKLSSCRMDAVMSAVESAPLVKNIMLYSRHVLDYFDKQGKMPSDEVIEQLLDQILRIFKLYRVTKLSKNKEEFKHLMHLIVLLSKIVYSNCTDLDNRIFHTVMNIWTLIIDQCSYMECSLAEFFEATYTNFAEVYLYSESTKTIDLSIPETVDCENFDKIVQKRFKSFKDLFSMYREILFPVLDRVIKGLCLDTQVGLLYKENPKCSAIRIT